MQNFIKVSVLLMLMFVFSFADVINVPADQSSIQDGINAAVDGDTVLVADGTYIENINYRGKLITVASHYVMDGDTGHISNTIIDGSHPGHPDSGSVVYFVSGEDTNSVLSGFTITGGTGTGVTPYPLWFPNRIGGGIYAKFSGAKIEKNKILNNNITAGPDTAASAAAIMAFGAAGDYFVIRDNQISENTATAAGHVYGAGVTWGTPEICVFEGNVVSANVANANYVYGGGIFLNGAEGWWQGNYIIRNNIIKNNVTNGSSFSGGGGLFLQNVSPELTNNIISGNVGFAGGGIWVHHLTGTNGIPRPVLINNTIINNSAAQYGGGIRVNGSNPSAQPHVTVMNTILWGNSASRGPQMDIIGGGSATVRYSDVQGSWPGNGNIDADPLFAPLDPMFHLHDTSPCVNSGADSLQINGLWYFCPPDDYEGDERPYMGRKADMGADETPVPVGIEPQPSAGIPGSCALFQNYPNPFNPTTHIGFRIADFGFVSLKVYDINGREVATLVSENLTAGSYEYQWDARGLAGGVYFYRLEAGQFKQTRKLLLLK